MSGKSVSVTLTMTVCAVVWADVCLGQDGAPAGVCAVVRIRIDQDVILARSALRASLTINNGEQMVPMEDLAVVLDIRDESGESADSLFAIEEELTGISDIDGGGRSLRGAPPTSSGRWCLPPRQPLTGQGDTGSAVRFRTWPKRNL